MQNKSNQRLNASISQYSSAGKKDFNQDLCAYHIPVDHSLESKGIVLAVADGISSSTISHIAAETSINALTADYYNTSEAWSVRTSAETVIGAANSWLYGENRRDRISDMNQGRVCTLSALIFKGHYAHILHVGDSRVWRLKNNVLEALTRDHTIYLSDETSQLGRALGAKPDITADYHKEPLEEGDIYILTTDGVHEFWNPTEVIDIIQAEDAFADVAGKIAHKALGAGSNDNLTIQIARIDQLPAHKAGGGLIDDEINLPIIPLPNPGETLDGYEILRVISSTARSHIYLATAPDDAKVVLKFPSVDMQENEGYLRRLLMEEWIARRISNPHVVSAADLPPTRSGLYTVTRFIKGPTLRQWMIDNPTPQIEEVRQIIEQVASGVRAFHRLEMLHQDLRPENIILSEQGVAQIIDFGSTYVAGVQETSPIFEDQAILGMVQYAAPEYFLGYGGTTQSDLFSLGVIAYEMLSGGQLPYGGKAARVRTQKDIRRLSFRSTLTSKNPLPDWVEYALQKAVHLDSTKRYLALSEFVADLRTPSEDFKRMYSAPLIEKNPVLFWQSTTVLFAVLTILLLAVQ